MAVVFEYQAMKGNKISEGRLLANNEAEAEASLLDQGFKILTLREQPKTLTSEFEQVLGFGEERMGGTDRILFTGQLASMLKAGLPLVEALEAFISEGKGSFSKIVRRILLDVQSGIRFSEALSRFPKTFNPVYLAVIKAGENSGTLVESLEYLAISMKKEQELMGKVRGAMIYPMTVVTAMILVMIFISIAVVPRIADFAESSGQPLPAYTQVFISATAIITNYWYIILSLVVAGLVGGVVFARSETGAEVLSKLVLQIPAIKTLVKRYNQARFCRLLGGFYRYGVSVTGSFEILEESLGNMEYKKACRRIKGRLTTGQTLAAALSEEEGLFSAVLIRLIRGAEKVGELDETLIRLATYYEEELEAALKNVTALIEPILVIFLGAGVLAIAMAVIVPIYKVTSGLQ